MYTFDGNWNTTLRLPPFQYLNNPEFTGHLDDPTLCRLHIYDKRNDNPLPEPSQLNTIHFLFDSLNAEEVLKNILVYMREVVYPQYQKFLNASQYPECYPALHTTADLHHLFALNEISVHYFERNDLAYYQLDVRTCLDPEHGLCLIMHGSRVLDHGERGGFDVRAILPELNLDKEWYEKEYQRQRREIAYFPVPKEGTLKPWQKACNEYYPFGLFHANNDAQIMADITSGLLPKELTRAQLLSMSIEHGRETLTQFLLALPSENTQSGFMAALDKDRFDILDTLIAQGLDVNGATMMRYSVFSQVLDKLEKGMHDPGQKEKLLARLEYLLRNNCNPLLEDESGTNSLTVLESYRNQDDAEEVRRMLKKMMTP